MLELNTKLLAKLDGDAAVRSEKSSDLVERLKKDCREGKLPYNIKYILSKLDNEDKRYIYRLLMSEIIVSDNTITISGML